MLTVILDNIRSTYNVGAIMRTMDAVGGGTLVACGITPYPDLGDEDDRSPVVISANTKQIAKTSLGAEHALTITHANSATEAIQQLPTNTLIAAIEQSPNATNLFDALQPPKGQPVAILLGSETEGIDSQTLALCDEVLQIPQRGTKESLNVSVAAGIALYHLARPRH